MGWWFRYYYDSVLEKVRTNDFIGSSLSLAGSGPMDTEDVATIAEALQSNTTVSSLNLMFRKLSLKQLCAITHILKKKNRTIKILNLSSTDIGDQGAVEIAEMLKVNDTLEQLDLNRCKISRQGYKAIGEALKVNKGLRKFSMHRNENDVEGYAAVVSGLEENPVLLMLEIGTIQNYAAIPSGEKAQQRLAYHTGIDALDDLRATLLVRNHNRLMASIIPNLPDGGKKEEEIAVAGKDVSYGEALITIVDGVEYKTGSELEDAMDDCNNLIQAAYDSIDVKVIERGLKAENRLVALAAIRPQVLSCSTEGIEILIAENEWEMTSPLRTNLKEKFKVAMEVQSLHEKLVSLQLNAFQ
jgi:hypothetical protein